MIGAAPIVEGRSACSRERAFPKSAIGSVLSAIVGRATSRASLRVFFGARHMPIALTATYLRCAREERRRSDVDAETAVNKCASRVA